MPKVCYTEYRTEFNTNIHANFLYQKRALKSSLPVINAGIVGECLKVLVAAVCPESNHEHWEKMRNLKVKEHNVINGNILPSAKSRFLSELRASHEQRLPDFSSGNNTATKI